MSPQLSLYLDTVLVPNFDCFFSLRNTTGEGFCLFGVPGVSDHVKDPEKTFLFGYALGAERKRVLMNTG